MTFLSRPSRAALTAGACATAMVLAGALVATPAQATHPTAKATTNCSPGVVNPSFPAPGMATNVWADSPGMKGKATVNWTWTNSGYYSGYTLYFRVLTSNGQCTKPMIYSTGKGRQCLWQKNVKQPTNWSCEIKRLSSGTTEFQVALWYQSRSGAWGPVVYSLWSGPFNVK